MKVFLAGEGPDELGDWYRPPQYRARPPASGIIEALLHKIGVSDFDIADARIWKTIKKYRFKPPVRGEVQNVLGLANEADEAGAEVLVFVRDQDGYTDREEDIDEGIRLTEPLDCGTRTPAPCDSRRAVFPATPSYRAPTIQNPYP